MVTETHHYNVSRKVSAAYSRVPADAAAHLDDAAMNKLEPYDFTAIKGFSMPYLSGFFAEKYSVAAQEMYPAVQGRIEGYAKEVARETVQGYSTVTVTSCDTSIRDLQTSYAFLPVWMVSYRHKEKDYMFLMNGQTGKIVGKPPLSRVKLLKWFGIYSGIIFAVLELLLLIGGVLI
jgi:hypothetical protein